MKKIVAILCMVSVLFTAVACSSQNIDSYEGKRASIQKNIKQVDLMPDMPRNYKFTDYKEKAEGLDRVLYDFAKNPEYVITDQTTWTPIGYWLPKTKNNYYTGRGFGVPSYVGHVINGQGSIALPTGGMPEGVTTLGTVWGASVAGIDKSNQKFIGADGKEYTYDFVEMAKQFYSNEGFVTNRIGGNSGSTFWYEVYPQVQFARIMNLYEMDSVSKEIILKSADSWVRVLPNFVDKGNGRFNYTSYSFFNDRPVLGRWAEPANGALAFLLINAYNLTGDMKYIDAAKEYIDYHEKDIRNPNYEIIQDYIPYAAAWLNFMGFANYNVEKFVNFLFDAEDDNRPTGIVQGDMWGEFDANGLMGYSNWENNHKYCWAFAMNTFHLSSILGPMLRYDPRFSDDIGKWYLNAINSARLFYGENLDSDHKSDPEIGGEIEKYVAYEGTSKNKRFREGHNSSDTWDESVTPYAMGDPTMRGWGQTDYGIYGAGHVGLFSVAKETNVEKILQIDISRMDDFAMDGDPQQYLYYNPYDEDKTVKINVGDKKVTLFDTVTSSVVKKSVKGETEIKIPAKSSMIITLIDPKAEIKEEDGYLKVNDIKLVKLEQASVSITSHVLPRVALQGTQTFEMDYKCLDGDKITKMVIAFEDHKLYEGAPIKSYDIDIGAIPDDAWVSTPTIRNASGNVLKYEGYVPEGAVKVMIYTEKGCYDISAVRIRKG